MADIAHIAGLVAAGLHPSPVPHCDFVTTTTHKTLRGPRAGMVMCKEQFAKDLDRAVFPGIQGGPLMHIIAAKAVAFKEALTDGVPRLPAADRGQRPGARGAPRRHGFRIVSGGTDNHVFLLDVSKAGLTGKVAEKALEARRHHGQQEHHPLRPEPAAGGLGHPHRHPGAHHPRHARARDGPAWATSSPRSCAPPRTSGSTSGVRARVRELCERFPLYDALIVGRSRCSSGPPASAGMLSFAF